MVKYAHHLFGGAVGQRMIQTGHQEQHQHAGAVYGGTDHFPHVADRTDDQNYGPGDRKRRSDAVGNGIGDFFAAGIKGSWLFGVEE